MKSDADVELEAALLILGLQFIGHGQSKADHDFSMIGSRIGYARRHFN
jgi:hypothetical protein